MAICSIRTFLSLAELLVLVLFSTVKAETRVEVSFTVNPVNAGSQTAFECKVWEYNPNQQIGMSRVDSKTNKNVVLVRDGQRVMGTPDNIFLDILPPQQDGSTPYRLTIVGVDEETDDGTYSCYVLTVNPSGNVDAIAADSIALDVTPAPETYLPPEEFPICSLSEDRLSYYAGEEITLTCSSLDGSPSITLQWIRNDNIEIPESDTTSQNGNRLNSNITHTLNEDDNGTVFKCRIISSAYPSDGQECSIGPIAVWKPSGTDSNYVTNGVTIDGKLNPRTILGLNETVFVIIVVALGVILLISVILLIVYCSQKYSCACLIRKRKSYKMDGRGNKDSNTLRSDGTLTAGVELQYIPARPAPAPPPPPSYVESQRDSMSQQRYTQNTTNTKRLSTVETALLLAVSKSLSRDQVRPQFNSSSSIAEEASNTEIIYANTSRSSSVVDLYNMGRDEDNDSGVVNPAYDGNNESGGFSADEQPTIMLAASHSRPLSQSEVIYHNTAELPIHTRSPAPESYDKPEYAKVDKSRTSTMESVKKEKRAVQPESVTSLDESSMYHNTSDLAINISDPMYPPPPPIPVNPPSPTTTEAETKPTFRPQLKSTTSQGGPEKPAFKPPPPPVTPRTSIYENTVIGEGDSDSGKPAKPVPPKKPTYEI